MEAMTLQRNIKALEFLYPGRVQAKPRPLEARDLPLWAKGMARIFKLTLPNGTHAYLLYPAHQTFEQLKQLHATVTKRLEGQVLVIADELPNRHRALLVKFRIPFIFKDESIFAPELGVKLGNLKKLNVEPRLEVEAEKQALTPFGLKIIAGILTDQLPKEFSLKTLFAVFQKKKTKLAISKLSIVLNELAEHELLQVHGAGPKKFYSCKDTEALWKKLNEIELSPFYREVQTNYIPKDRKTYITAGERALVHYSNLAEQKQTIIAMTPGDFRRIYQQEKSVIPYGDFGNPSTVQIWKSDPKLFSIDGALNPIELYFSMRDNPDERIQMSLDEMLKQYNLERKD